MTKQRLRIIGQRTAKFLIGPFGAFLLALALVLIVSNNRQDVGLHVAQVAVFWLPLLLLLNLPRIIEKWRQSLLALAATLLALLGLYLVGPLVLRYVVLPAYSLDVDHRLTPSSGYTNADGVIPDVPASYYGPDDFNIIFLGDSFTQGLNLSNFRDAFPFVIEKRLRERFPGKPIKVVDFGWIGSSPVLEARQLRQIGAKYHPKLVVQVFDMTDFHDDIRYTNALKEYGLDKPHELSIFRAMLVRFSLLVGVNDFGDFLWGNLFMKSNELHNKKVRQLGWTPREIDKPEYAYGEYFFTFQPLAKSEPYFETSWNAINETAAIAHGLGAKFAFFVMPRYQQYNRAECPRDPKKAQFPPSDEYLFEVFKYFDKMKAVAKFPIHSLLPDFQHPRFFPTVFEDDFHLNENGHMVAADGIVRDLTADGLFDDVAAGAH